MKIKEVVNALETFAPLPLQDGFDNAGMQVGLTDAEATGALLCLDVTEQVIDEAIALGCNLIVSHHPLIFKGIKSLTGRGYVERCIMKAVRNDISIFSMHTNLDNALQGVNCKIAEKIGLKNVTVLDPKEGMLLKLVTYVPHEKAGEVRRALFEAGCGCIGNYDSCSYNVKGEGTFRAQEGCHPYCGEIGTVHTEQETRIETVVPAFHRIQAVEALLAAHPYEEPAYDIYLMQNGWNEAGGGVVGELEMPEPETDFLLRIKEIFGVECVKHSRTDGRTVRKVALCGGAGAFLLPKAIGANADVFITGEVKYHDYFTYGSDILIAEIGHYESEQYTGEIIYSIIRDKFPALDVRMTSVGTNPVKYL